MKELINEIKNELLSATDTESVTAVYANTFLSNGENAQIHVTVTAEPSDFINFDKSDNIDSKYKLTRDQKNDICCDFFAKFGGLNKDEVNKGVKVSDILKWTINNIDKLNSL